MFHRLTDLFKPHHATVELLTRQDNRLLDDIGLTRGDLDALLCAGGAGPRGLPMWFGAPYWFGAPLPSPRHLARTAA